MKNMPGPLCPLLRIRPKRKMTALSYSCAICIIKKTELNVAKQSDIQNSLSNQSIEFQKEQKIILTLMQVHKENGKKTTRSEYEMKTSIWFQMSYGSSSKSIKSSKKKQCSLYSNSTEMLLI